MALFLRSKNKSAICQCNLFTEEASLKKVGCSVTLFLRNKSNQATFGYDSSSYDGSLDVANGSDIMKFTKVLMLYPCNLIGIAQILSDLREIRDLLWEENTPVVDISYFINKAVSKIKKSMREE